MQWEWGRFHECDRSDLHAKRVPLLIALITRIQIYAMAFSGTALLVWNNYCLVWLKLRRYKVTN
jgi:hypothetical protein